MGLLVKLGAEKFTYQGEAWMKATKLEAESDQPELAAIQDRDRILARLPASMHDMPAELELRRVRAGGSGEPPHIDSQPKNGNAISVTVLTFLGDVEEGGDIVFPLAAPKASPACGEDIAACCERSGLR